MATNPTLLRVSRQQSGALMKSVRLRHESSKTQKPDGEGEKAEKAGLALEARLGRGRQGLKPKRPDLEEMGRGATGPASCFQRARWLGAEPGKQLRGGGGAWREESQEESRAWGAGEPWLWKHRRWEMEDAQGKQRPKPP